MKRRTATRLEDRATDHEQEGQGEECEGGATPVLEEAPRRGRTGEPEVAGSTPSQHDRDAR